MAEENKDPKVEEKKPVDRGISNLTPAQRKAYFGAKDYSKAPEETK